MDDVVWLTYDEISERLGIERESARTLTKRKHWARRPGNDGKVRIGVPAELLGERTDPGTEPGSTPETVPPAAPVQSQEPDPVQHEIAAALRAQIEALETRAAELRVDVERERTERVEERARAERLVGEVAALARDLARVTDDAAGRERELRDRAAAAETALIEFRARPWWRRLVG